jgi:hypothetical protein
MQSMKVNHATLKRWRHQQAQQQAKKPPDLKSSVSLREYGRHRVCMQLRNAMKSDKAGTTQCDHIVNLLHLRIVPTAFFTQRFSTRAVSRTVAAAGRLTIQE